MAKPIKKRNSNSYVIRVVGTYRVKADSTTEACDKVGEWLDGNLPTHIQSVGKAEVFSLKSMLKGAL